MADNRPDIVCPPEPSVFVWPAAYFNTSSKKWENGELQVTPSTLCFYNVPTKPTAISTPEKQSRCLLKLIHLDDLADIKKASSSYVFKCVVVLMRDGDEHWFGSLPGRDGAYNVLLHFWRERLLSHGTTTRTAEGGSAAGKELLSLAQESANILKSAGETLARQGEQLDYAKAVMLDLHNDLDTANQLTNSLESWYSHWGLNHADLPTEPLQLIDPSGIPIIHEFPVLYHEAGSAHKAHQSQSLLTKVHLSPKRGPPIQELSGFLSLSSEGVTVLDADHTPVQHYGPGDVSLVNVSSPWRVSIIKYCIGEPDVVYKVTSTQMMDILKVLHSIAHDKIQYECPVGEPVMPQCNGESSPSDEHQLEVTVHAHQATAGSHGPHTDLQPSTSAQLGATPRGTDGKQTQSTTGPVKVEEVNQLSELIGHMKSMALDIQREEDKQSETIDSLTDTVDRANIRLHEATDRVNKLL